MNTKTISNRALATIDQYLHFNVGQASCSIPYFNNKVSRSRGALRAYIGKGSTHDIYDEVVACMVKDHVAVNLVTDESLKMYLTDKNIGMDCSGFAYYILDTESRERKLGQLDKKIHFTNCKGITGKIRCALRPVENCDVKTFACEKNSRVIDIKDALPGDIITMTDSATERDHILVIHQIEYQNFIPTNLHYSHTIAYPEDGVYNTGTRQGVIEIFDLNKKITEQNWLENGVKPNSLISRAQRSNTTLRRLNWM